MKYLLTVMVCLLYWSLAIAKPHCQSFNNYDNKVTIVFTDDKVGSTYIVSDAKLIPSWNGREYKATSLSVSVNNGVATVTFQYYGEGTLKLVDGPVLVNNDRVLLEGKTFRLNYTAQSSEAVKFGK